MIHKYQLRDAIHRQEINKLTKANELLKEHVKSVEKELEKTKKNRELVIFIFLILIQIGKQIFGKTRN